MRIKFWIFSLSILPLLSGAPIAKLDSTLPPDALDISGTYVSMFLRSRTCSLFSLRTTVWFEPYTFSRLCLLEVKAVWVYSGTIFLTYSFLSLFYSTLLCAVVTGLIFDSFVLFDFIVAVLLVSNPPAPNDCFRPLGMSIVLVYIACIFECCDFVFCFEIALSFYIISSFGAIIGWNRRELS